MKQLEDLRRMVRIYHSSQRLSSSEHNGILRTFSNFQNLLMEALIESIVAKEFKDYNVCADTEPSKTHPKIVLNASGLPCFSTQRPSRNNDL